MKFITISTHECKHPHFGEHYKLSVIQEPASRVIILRRQYGDRSEYEATVTKLDGYGLRGGRFRAVKTLSRKAFEMASLDVDQHVMRDLVFEVIDRLGEHA